MSCPYPARGSEGRAGGKARLLREFREVRDGVGRQGPAMPLSTHDGTSIIAAMP